MVVIYHLSADDETSNVFKLSVKNMFAHVLALCFMLKVTQLCNLDPCSLDMSQIDERHRC